MRSAILAHEGEDGARVERLDAHPSPRHLSRERSTWGAVAPYKTERTRPPSTRMVVPVI